MESTQAAKRASGPTRESFVRSLCDVGLLQAEEIERTLAAGSVAQHGSSTEAEAVANCLVAAGKLTSYQAELALEGKASDLVIGNYEVLDRLGAGGMGTVFKARHRRMKRIVALKLLYHVPGQTASFVQRFQREVEVIARLTHPNIVMAFDADEAPVGHFLVMELIQGRDLCSEVHARGPLPVTEAVNVILQAARGLAYAHEQGVIHRDIKPANILRDAAGTVKITDLGLAKATAESGLTQSGMVMGTVDYMAPEAAYGNVPADHRLDIYSLGCTLYYLLNGAPPYQGANLMAVLLQHQTNPVPRLAVRRPDVPAALDAVFLKMVAKRPEERHQSIAEMIRELEGLDLTGVPAVPQFAARGADAAGGDRPDYTRLVTSEGMAATIDLPDVSGQAAKALPVLLVEPSRAQARIIRQMLLELDAGTVLEVSSGEKALEAVRQSRPRAIVTALHLTDMTGVDLVQRVRAESTGSAVGMVLITSGSDAGALATLSGLGHLVRLPKPFNRGELGEALKQATAHEKEGIAFAISSTNG